MKGGVPYERANSPVHGIQRHFSFVTRDQYPGVSFIPYSGRGIPGSFSNYADGPGALTVLLWGGPRSTFWFAILFGDFFFGLSVFGLATGHATMLHLQPFDHPFHLALGGLGFLAVGAALYQSQKRKQASI